jgi:alkylhydroperoxidase family enzyme
MAYVKVLSLDEAEGALRERYEKVVAGGHKVFNIVSASSIRPGLIETFFAHYARVMAAPDSGRTRAEREMIATVTSAANRCEY